METATITLDHYMELLSYKTKLEVLQERLNKEILLKDDILGALGLEETYFNEWLKKLEENKERENG